MFCVSEGGEGGMAVGQGLLRKTFLSGILWIACRLSDDNELALP